MIKKEIYPKTKRIKNIGEPFVITEKLDGSNLVIFKKDEELYFAQRRRIFSLTEVLESESNKILYKGLYQWILDHGQELKEKLWNDSAICGEWIGMGQIKYGDALDKRFYMFAKANIKDDFKLENIVYKHENFIYPFADLTIPDFIGIVPIAAKIYEVPDKYVLDQLYQVYCEMKNRPVEGFVIDYKSTISKYVRMSNGKLIDYDEKARKGE